jgi:hypothetical protein
MWSIIKSMEVDARALHRFSDRNLAGADQDYDGIQINNGEVEPCESTLACT